MTTRGRTAENICRKKEKKKTAQRVDDIEDEIEESYRERRLGMACFYNAVDKYR